MPNLQTESYYSTVPDLSSSRSIFKRPRTLKTSFDVGQVIPCYFDILYPGDTVQIETSKIVRLQTLINPVYDNLYLDTYWFFVPMRLTWEHTKNFFGENDSGPWVSQTQYKIPSISSPATTGFASYTLADYFGLPINTVWDNQAEARPMALPFRAYCAVINHYFVDENIDYPCNFSTGDTNQTGSNGSNYVNDCANGGMPFIARRYHDYFSSCQPQPMKPIYGSGAVSFPLISGDGALAPVGTRNSYSANLTYANGWHRQLRFKNEAGSTLPTYQNLGLEKNVSVGDLFTVVSSSAATQPTTTLPIYPANLWADLSTSVGAVTVNQLRMAILLQAFYERVSSVGSRYGELIKGIFGVSNPDARLQDPEYLGGNRIALNINEVINQAQATNDFLGDLGAYSRTVDSHFDVEFSATEHGFLMCLCVARYDNTYSQGLDKMWTRLDPLEWYNPYVANLGAMPVYDFELYADATAIGTRSVFGYNEAWSDLRYSGSSNQVTGEMRPGISNTLASWHFADYYSQKPTLSSGWLAVDKTNVDRTLAVQSSNANQLFADFFFDCTYTRVLPMYSIPSFNAHF